MIINPVLTIVIPVYNSAEYLDRCFSNLNKMIGENTESVEIIFINDGSTDTTLEKVKREAKNKSYYRVINKEHTGVSDTRNWGIRKARGKYITFLDSDDNYCKNFIPVFLSEIKSKPDIVWNDVINLSEDKLKKIDNKAVNLSLMQMVLGISKEKIQEGIASKFYKVSFLRNNSLFFNNKVVVSEDTLFILQALSKANSIFLSSKKFYSILEEHSLNRFNPNTLRGEIEFRKQVQILLDDYKESEAKKLINDRTKINGFCALIYRYFGPLIEYKKIAINQAAEKLEKIAVTQCYISSFNNSQIDKTLSLRYIILRKILAKGNYKGALIVDVLFDKLKRQSWK